jgi:hydroxymethylbilane synthase
LTRLRVGARGSRLSRAQTQIVADMLSSRVAGLEIEIVPIKTRGDGVPPERRNVDGKTAFTGEIEDLLLSGYVDAAVHSMKDLPVEARDGLTIGATPPRGDPRDALVSAGGQDFWGLRKGATLGTSSLRRRAQLLALRSDLSVVDLHGNVETRIRKMGELNLDAVVLAASGLERISESARVSHHFSLEEIVPAAGQATLAVQVRKGDPETEKVVASIDDASARLEAVCERAFTKSVGGDCFVPVGACARTAGPSLTVSGVIASPDGRELVRRTLTSPSGEAEELGRRLGEEMLSLGGERILRGLLP